MLTASPKTSGHLQYRYLDTGETVTVPNTWYNQPVENRVAQWRHHADEHAAYAAKVIKDPPFGVTRAGASKMVDRHTALAWVCRKVAQRLEKEREAIFFRQGDLYKQFSTQKPVLEE